MLLLIQYLIHKLEVASEMRLFKYGLAVLAVLFFAATYNVRQFRNFSTAEAMDAAQVGRNLSEGRGYTTLFVRPLSMHLIQERNQKHPPPPEAGNPPDLARIRGAHPDIANPPVYPVLLSGLMRVLPFDYTVSTTKRFWSSNGYFRRYQPDFLIGLFNQFLLGALILLGAYWARRVFDRSVAWTASVLLLGSELLWRFSISGLSTLLLLIMFMGLVWCLTLLETEARDPKCRVHILFALAAATGVLVGLGALTRYSFLWLIIPTSVFLVLFGGPRRSVLCGVSLVAFAAVIAPWIIRNYLVCGRAFGTAAYCVIETTDYFVQDTLQRSLDPDARVVLSSVWVKLLSNSRAILQDMFTSMGGIWTGCLFLASLMVGFINPSVRRIRYFLVMSLGVLIVVQALGRTQLSEDSPEINSENLLVLLAPMIMIYGVGFFFMLLDQIKFPVDTLRYPVIGLFGLLVCLPMIFSLALPRNSPVAYPPYHPLLIQQTASWMKDSELMMSDIPWAVAWYGNRQCVWITLNATPDPNDPNAKEDFLTINDYLKPISGLYLTQRTTDARFVSGWIRAREYSWGSFIVDTIVKKEVPTDFPLRQMPNGYLPEQLFLSDWTRWR